MTDTSGVTDLKGFVTFRLARLQSRLNAQAIRVLRRHSDLSLTEWRVLALTAEMAGGTLSDFVRETELDKGQLSRGIASLVKKGYVQSKINKKDQRQHMLHLSGSGADLHRRILPIMKQRQKNLTDGLSMADLETAYRVFAHLDAASEHDPD